MKESNTSKNKVIAKNTFFLYTKTLLSLLISLYTSRVVLQVLGVVDFGIYNVVAGFVAMFELFRGSLTTATQRFYNYENGQNGAAGVRNVYTSTCILQIILSIIAILFFETVGLWYIENKMVIPSDRLFASKMVFQCSVISFILVILEIPYSSIIIAKEKMLFYSIVGFADVLLKLIGVLIIPLIGADHLHLYAIVMLTISLLNFSVYYIYSKINFKEITFTKKFKYSTLISMAKFMGWSAFNSISHMVKNQGVNIVLNFYFGPVVNAARGVSYQIKSALIGFVVNITTAARPQLVEEYSAGNYERATNIMFTISKVAFISLYILSLPVIININCILGLWLGDNVPNLTNIFTIWVILVTLMDIMITPLQMIVYAKGNIAVFNIINSVISILILPIAIVTFEMIKNPLLVFIESFVLSSSMLLCSMFVVKHEIGMKIGLYLNKVIFPLIKIVVISLIAVFASKLMPEGFVNLVVISILSTLIIMVSFYYLGLDKGEQAFVSGFIRKRMPMKFQRHFNNHSK